MDMDYQQLAESARAALIVTAARRSVITYGELGRAIGLPTDVPLSHHINRVLRVVSKRCVDAREPSLAVLAVSKDSGEPGPGFVRGARDWSAEAQQCFRYWVFPG